MKTPKESEDLEKLKVTVRGLTQSTQEKYLFSKEQFKVIEQVHAELAAKKK